MATAAGGSVFDAGAVVAVGEPWLGGQVVDVDVDVDSRAETGTDGRGGDDGGVGAVGAGWDERCVVVVRWCCC